MNILDDDGYNENNESDGYYDRSHKRKRQKVLIWNDDRKPPQKNYLDQMHRYGTYEVKIMKTEF